MILAIKNGDEIIFRSVFHEYHEKVYYYILSKTKSAYLAEEVVQLTFVKLWKYKGSLNQDISLSNQLFRIATTTLIDLLRKQNTSTTLIRELKELSPSISNDVLEKSNIKETNNQLLKAIDKLPPVRKKVFEMSRINDMSYKEIAEELSISTKTVEHHISKAIKEIKFYLALSLLILCFQINFSKYQNKTGVTSFTNVYSKTWD